MYNKSSYNSDDDSIKRFVEKEITSEFSPMNPPDVYNPQNIKQVPYEKMHPFLQKLIDEHKVYTDILRHFEEALINWYKNKWIFNDEINEKFKKFFIFIDDNIPLHNQKEEKKLFPLLHKKLVEVGENNSIDSSVTSINIMEDEHIKVAQAAAIIFNFLGLGAKLSDNRSREITFQKVFDQGIAIVETMKLHIFREENILFPQAMILFTKDELENLI